jgi:hypothetical protein
MGVDHLNKVDEAALSKAAWRAACLQQCLNTIGRLEKSALIKRLAKELRQQGRG